ncbi:MAG: MATE family efflux transporter [Spirochaetaceae bacterium]|jgi:putative MATE family efflux protein|nr:MATE family efflux transporter [Spirochaetaceae bacterium]
MTKNMTIGPPWQLIVSFALPLIIGNMFQQFYNMADSFIVSRTIGTGALAAVGSTGSINFLILGFMIGFTQGASIVTAQRFGAGDERGVRRSFACGILLSAVITAVLMAVSIISLKSLLRLLNTPEEIVSDAYIYMITILWGMPAITLFDICSNMMRAVGDSRTPLYFLVIACIINIILDYIFILVFGMGVFGAGLATVIAQLTSGVLCIPAIFKRIKVLCVTKDDWKLRRNELWDQARAALPLGFQLSIIAIGALAVSFAVNKLGTIPVAAFTTGQRIDQFAGMPLSSIGAAMTTYTAQNFGAKKIGRIRKGVFQGGLIAFGLALLIGILFIAGGRTLARIFLKEAAAVGLAKSYLTIQGACFIMLGQLFVYRQTLLGLGNSIVPTISGVVELIMRIVTALALAIPFGFIGICFASPLAWAGGLIPLVISLVFTLKRLRLKELSGR